MTMRRLWLIPTLISLTIPAAAWSGTPDYMPLYVGNEWGYIHPTLGGETRTVDGMITIRGSEVFVIRWDSAPNAGLENYWTTGPDGDLVLWGFFRALDNFGVLYDPPLIYLDAPLALGKTWGQTSHIYYLPDTTDAGAYAFTFGISETGPVTVPAGTFDSFGLGSGVTGPKLQSVAAYELTGERRTGVAGSTARDWFSDGVGEVQYTADQDLFKLTNYTLPTAARAWSWGAIKSAYR